MTILGTSAWQSVSSQTGTLAVPRELANKARLPTADEESQAANGVSSPGNTSSLDTLDEKKVIEKLNQNKTVFTWKNLNYTASTPSSPRQLLDNVHGLVKPGQLVALMGFSGAGKTTLMDVLAQRKTDGRITGPFWSMDHYFHLISNALLDIVNSWTYMNRSRKVSIF